MAATERDSRSIGEVLVALKPEFPDITISKIRFLETEGLIDPERTASGYRKFSETDVTKLRRILRLQRDEYLPLRVIRKRLAQDGDGPVEVEEPEDETDADDEIGPPERGLQMTREEMAQSTGVEPDRIDQLVSFGLLHPRTVGEEQFFDGEDLTVLNIVADFFKFGVEARHLTMFRHFADREAAFLQTIIMPLMRQRNPDARRAATSSLTELAGVSRRLKQALLRANLRRALGR